MKFARDYDSSSPDDEAAELVNQLGGPDSARATALRYKQSAKTNKARSWWSAVIAAIDSDW